MNTHFSAFLRHSEEMAKWCQHKCKKSLFYLSADIRNAGFKVTPVDVNMFPAGFHVISEESQMQAAHLIAKHYSNKIILLITENHTRNSQYLSNVLALKKILETAGNRVILGNLANQKMDTLDTARFYKSGNHIVVEDNLVPELIILNNDMISEDPAILSSIIQPCVPPPILGWYKRRKSHYFSHYQKIVEEFSSIFDIDPWLLHPYSKECNNVDFTVQSTLSKLADTVDEVIEKTRKKYEQYKIESEPFVFIKANSGSYGIGISTATHSRDVLHMNKKNRNKLKKTKGSTSVTNIIVQEGIETIESYDNHPSEVLMYSVLGKQIAFVQRYNTKHTRRQNLNSTGMFFVDCTQNYKKNTVLNIVSNLAIIAAEKESQELIEMNPE